MAERNPAERYSLVAITFHWTIAALIVANLPLGIFNHQIEDSLGKSTMWLHKSIGLTVLLLTVARLGWRLAHSPPPLPQAVPHWQAATARLMHWLFYLLLLLVPLSGWVRSSASPYPLTWFALIDVPKFGVARNSVEAQIASNVHDFTALLMIPLLAVHVTAALYHHFLLRDSVLIRMLPGWRRDQQLR